MDEIKIVHYCWFGNKKIPKKYQNYIKKWKRMLPDYKFIMWNEENFDVNLYDYTREAYKEKKYAFVCDVARIYALYNFGGYYFDTDVEIVKKPANFNFSKAILGIESPKDNTIGTAVMYFPINSSICKKILSYYEKTHFVEQDGKLNLKPNTHLLSEILKLPSNSFYTTKAEEHEDFTIYPSEYFTGVNYNTGRAKTTANTFFIHHFGASWFSISDRLKMKLRQIKNRLIK